MLLPTLISVAGLLATAAEAAPRGAGFNRIPRDGRGLQAFRARVAARSDNHGPSDSYSEDHYLVPPKNSSTSATNTKTLDPSLQCPTGGVHVSTKTVDITVTVTASSNVSHVETYRGNTKTATSNNTFYQPPNKYVSPGPYGTDTEQVYPGSKTATIGGEQPGNATYLPPYKTETAEDPEETGSWTDEYPYLNSTMVPPYTAPIDKHASETDYQYPNQTKVYSTPGGYNSAPPAYTRPAYIKPVYSNPASGNSTIPPLYTKPAYTEPTYSDPSSGNSTIPPVYTKPVYTRPAYSDPTVPGNSTTPPVYTKPVVPGNSSTVTRPVYTDPIAPGNSSTIEPPVYTKPAYTEPLYYEPAIPGNSSAATPPVYTKPVYTDPVVPGNSSTAEAPIYTPPPYTKPVYSEPVVPNNSTDVPPVYTKPVDTTIYTPPVYTKPAHLEPATPRNSTDVPPVYTKPADTPIYTPPVYTTPVYSEPTIPKNSTDIPPVYTKPVDTPIYTPPVYTKPVITEPSVPGNSTEVPPAYTKPVDTPVYTPPVYTMPVYSDPVTPENSSTIPPVYTRPADTPVYSPPAYTKPALPRDSSDAYPQPSIDTNSTVPPVIPTPSSSDAVSTAVLTSISVYPPPEEITNGTPTRSFTVTPFLPTTATPATSPTETCVIDSSMVPISTSYFNTTTTTMPPYPTETVCEHTVEDGALRESSAYCGVHGKPAGAYFIAEYVENRHGQAVTLEGCYQFCSSSTDFTRGCQAYHFYHDTDRAPRCALYRMPVSSSASELDGTVEDLWFDLTCGSPAEDAWHQGAAADHQQTGSHGGASNIGFGFGF